MRIMSSPIPRVFEFSEGDIVTDIFIVDSHTKPRLLASLSVVLISQSETQLS